MDKYAIKDTIIKTILKHGHITRTELVAQQDIRPATLFEIINKLKSDGIIDEPERKTIKTGRKASKICLNPDFACYLGIDFEMEHTIGVLIDGSGNTIMKKIVSSPAGKDKKRGLDEIKCICKDAESFLGKDINLLKGVGFSDAGVVDVDNATLIKAVNVDGWENINMKKIFQETMNIDCVAYPGASARAFMEYSEFSRENNGSLFHIELGYGVGGGYVKNDSVFIGDSYSGMEVGHIVINENGTLCQCGNKGCLETIAGAEGIKKSIEKIIESGVPTLLAKEDFSIEYFVDCVRKNDKAACALAMNICECIGIALASVVSILNPAAIVFSGPLSKLDDILISTVKNILSLRCFPSAMDKSKIYVSNLPKEATATGAAYLMRRKYLLK